MNYSYDKAVQEILHGHSYAKQLKMRLDDPMANDGSVSSYDLATSIVDCFSNAITSLSDIPKSNDDDQFSDLSSKDSSPSHPQMSHSKKRRNSKTSSSENWRDDSPSPIYDGYLWRKYGEKYIKNSDYQRSYYRCSYNTDHQCGARKHEQQIKEDPPVYRTTYFGHHTCQINHNQDPMITTVVDPVDDLENSRMIRFGKDLLDQENKENHSSGFHLSVKHEENCVEKEIMDKRTGYIDQDCQDLMEDNLSISNESCEYDSVLIWDNLSLWNPHDQFDLWR